MVFLEKEFMIFNVKKRTLGHVLPMKIQIRLHICAVRSESLLGTFWIAKDAKFLHRDNKDSDQTADVQGPVVQS